MLTEELAALARFHQFDETQLDRAMLDPVQKGVELVMINITHQHGIDFDLLKTDLKCSINPRHDLVEFIPTRIAILTVSNRRGEEDDTSGHYLRDSAQEAGHHVVDKAIVKENRYAIRAQVSAWIASDDVQVVLITGGTGLTEGDQAPEALLPLFDREVEGFGEVFRMLSFEEIGTSTLQSRAVAGVANKTLIFAMPGSTKACRTAWENIIAPQLDARTRPCNFHPHLKK